MFQIDIELPSMQQLVKTGRSYLFSPVHYHVGHGRGRAAIATYFYWYIHISRELDHFSYIPKLS